MAESNALSPVVWCTEQRVRGFGKTRVDGTGHGTLGKGAAAIDEAMRVAIPSLERLADVVGLTRSRRSSRSDHIDIYSYRVHGAGCRFVSDNGTEVDVDFAADGSEIATAEAGAREPEPT